MKTPCIILATIIAFAAQAGTVYSDTLGPDGQILVKADAQWHNPRIDMHDTDGDGLPNSVETLVSSLSPLGINLSTTKARSGQGQSVTDYFLPAGKLYIGEMFTDHDWMEDDVEDVLGYSRLRHDPWSDADGDGWSNYSEVRSLVALGSTTVTNGFSTNIVSRIFTLGESDIADMCEAEHRMDGTFISSRSWSNSAKTLKDLNEMYDKVVTYYDLQPVTRAESLYVGQGGVPVPHIDVTVHYNGNKRFEWYVVEAWHRGRSTLDLPDARWAFEADGSSVQHVVLHERSGIREGLNTFVVYGAGSGSEQFQVGMPYGFVRDVDVGWASGRFEVEVTDMTSVMARMNLPAAASSDFATASDATDRGTSGTSAGVGANVPAPYVGTNLSARSSTRVRVVRNWINCAASASFTDVVWDGYVDLGVHPTITEVDVLGDSQLDLDWGAVAPAFTGGRGSAKSMTNVSYRIVVGDGQVGSFENNDNNLPVQFVNVFEDANAPSRTVPLEDEHVFHGTHPVFRWTHPNTIGKAYPAFQLKVWRTTDGTTADGLVYDSGALRSPPRDANGIYAFTAPVSLDFGSDYLWSVSMLDAKFTEFSPSETKARFRMGRSPGSLAVSVVYHGPATVSTDHASPTNIVRVGLYAVPDFVGVPVCETRLSNTNQYLGALFDSVPFGTYFVRAYIDTNGNAKKDPWESWGYGCEVRYTPKMYTVGYGATTSAVVCIEDADVNNNRVPDAIEWDAESDAPVDSLPIVPYRLWFPTMEAGSSSVTPVDVFDALALPDGVDYLSCDSELVNGGSVDPWSVAFSLSDRSFTSAPRPVIRRFTPSSLDVSIYAPLLLDKTTLAPTGTQASAISVQVSLEHKSKTSSSWESSTLETWTLRTDGIQASTRDAINDAIKGAVEAHRTNSMYRVRIDY